MAASFASVLPGVKQTIFDRSDHDAERRTKSQPTVTTLAIASQAPAYGHRQGWVPRAQQDYGDGGAYPEIHIAQYPLGLGRTDPSPSSTVLPTQLDAEGNIRYDAIAKVGHGKDKVVHSKFQDLVPKTIDADDPDLKKPGEDVVRETTERTRAALEKLVQGKISAAMPVRHAEKQAPAQYIRYTPSQQGIGYNSGAKQRIIRMVEVQKDPMEPPKFKTNKKIPRGPPSPPAPVLHSPNRKVTVKEQQEWKIPPCISNWKNARGYTIPLDKRLAADGRGLQGVHINENFSKLAESLYIAERKAREAVETRAQLEKKVAQKEKEKKEEGLRQLAQKARDERAGIRTIDKDDDLKDRDDLRKDRQKERQRERNLARAAPNKRNRLQREGERDISEKIALGLPAATKTSGDAMYDQRLFNTSKGLDSGFGAGEDEAYNVYSEPWRKDQNVSRSIYSKKDKDPYGDDLDRLMKGTNRFVPDKEFSGTDRSAAARRDGPVQFEKDEEEDIFGLNKFLTEAKRSTKRPAEESSSSSSRHDRNKKRRE